MENNTPTDQLPVEWQELIRIKAEQYIDKEYQHYAAPHLLFPIYEAGATPYALRAYRAESVLQQILDAPAPANENEMWSWIQTARNLANQALQGEKEGEK